MFKLYCTPMIKNASRRFEHVDQYLSRLKIQYSKPIIFESPTYKSSWYVAFALSMQNYVIKFLIVKNVKIYFLTKSRIKGIAHFTIKSYS